VKPLAFVLTLVIAIASLGVIVWLGKYGGHIQAVSVKTDESTDPVANELPMPKDGPLGEVEIENTQFSFGTRHIGDKGTHEFVIKNSGKGPLAFRLGKPTCQCTVGEIKQANGETISGDEKVKEGEVKPGETVTIVVNWEMKTANEMFRQVVPVYTTDPNKRVLELVIVGEVDVLYHLVPGGVWTLGDMSGTEPLKASGHIGSKVLEAFEVEATPASNSKVTLSLTPVTDEEELRQGQIKSGFNIRAEIDPSIPMGAFRETIPLKITSGRGDATINLILVGRRTGPIEIRGANGASFNLSSNRLVLGEFPASQGKKATVNFWVKELSEDLKLLSLGPSDTRVKVTVPPTGKKVGNAVNYQIEFEVPSGAPADHHDREAELLTLTFNHPTVPEFKIIVDYTAK
jgi:hypothetical protein